MSRCSSESDVTISLQDSPEPSPHLRSGGMDNKGYISSKDEKHHTSLMVETPMNSNIVNLIPAKPAIQLGPFEPLSDYFIPINHHKKFFRRSEKLYVTKNSKEKENRRWGRLGCGALGLFLLAGLGAVTVLVILDVLHIPLLGITNGEVSAELMATSTTTLPSITTDSNNRGTTGDQGLVDTIMGTTHLKNTTDVEFSLENGKFEAALANKTSLAFRQLSLQLQSSVTQILGESIQQDLVVVKVQEFTPEPSGSIYTKLRIGWSDDAINIQGVRFALRNVTKLGLGTFSVKLLKFFDVVNLCKFSNNNGCSHICSFDSNHLQFQCSCPEPLLLSKNDLKTCVQISNDEITITSTESDSTLSNNPEPEAGSTMPEEEYPQPTPITTTPTITTTVTTTEAHVPTSLPTQVTTTGSTTTYHTTVVSYSPTLATTTSSTSHQEQDVTTVASLPGLDQPEATESPISKLPSEDQEDTTSGSDPNATTTTTQIPEEFNSNTESNEIEQTEKSEVNQQQDNDSIETEGMDSTTPPIELLEIVTE